jgi:L-threonylcarbamoyladenylate synthase
MIEIGSGPEAIDLGAERLKLGKLVAFPTETVYGLGADALNADAVARVFELKGRPASNPLIVHVPDIDMAQRVVGEWSHDAQRAAEKLWPGPVTLVLPKSSCVPGIVCAQGDTVAVRCPEHPCALALIEAFGSPIVGPSANPSGRISPTTPEHVVDGFTTRPHNTDLEIDPEIDLLVIDGGHCRSGLESTVVDLTGERAKVLRVGVVGAETISQALGHDVDCITQSDSKSSPESDIARSPGHVGAHYQPTKPTRLVQSGQLKQAKKQTVLISWSIDTHPDAGGLIQLPRDIEGFGAGLYRSMHEADKLIGDSIWIEIPNHEDISAEHRPIYETVMERLGRATHA